jgi:tRNA-specific 2-thiouridylase
MKAKQRIVVGLSGGVDSSVAAWLLKREGHEVVGVFMKNWEDDDTDLHCTSRQDLVDAAAVADVIGIDFDAVNFASEYRERVFASFLRDYSAARTPNPDVLCNSEIKFKSFLDHAQALGADAIATGHYAGLRSREGKAELLKATDTAKDQTYFLHQLTQRQLSVARFPLAAMNKRTVRAIAREQGIPTHAKKDSTGICFIGERPFAEFLARYLPREPGPIETPEGRVVGRHNGLAYHTLGQRQGLRIGGVRDAIGSPWFVARKDVQRNALIVVQGHEHPLLYASALETGPIHWIAEVPPKPGIALAAKTRYRMPDASCRLVPCGSDRWRAVFDAPQWAPTPGQYLVIYEGDVCLGGGVIQHAGAEPSLRTSDVAVAAVQ